MPPALLSKFARVSPRVFGHSQKPCLAIAARHLASSSAPPFPTVPICPEPTCRCAPTPEMPEGFEIDHEKSLNGLMPAYHQAVLVCTGKDDWPSNIREENGSDNLAASLSALFTRGGPFVDPYHNVSVLNASFPSPEPPEPLEEPRDTNAVYLLPEFKYIPFVSKAPESGHPTALARGYLLPKSLSPAYKSAAMEGSPDLTEKLARKPALGAVLGPARDVDHVMVLICGHGGRDQRCGIYGPLLRGEFERKLPSLGVEVLSGPESDPSADAAATGRTARVGLISHIGGHRFAGNVIVYLPPGLQTDDGESHPLAGHGIWYGRVEPRHVEGIVRETVGKGVVIEELFRGGMTPESKVLRL